MRAIPSPTSSTRPTSRTSIPERYWSISACRTETISSALNLMTASRDELVPKVVEACADRAVVDPVAHVYYEAADQLGIDLGFHDRLQMESILQFLAEPLALVL